jgi:hypothetical protein
MSQKDLAAPSGQARAAEAARIAFEQDAKTRDGGAYGDVDLSQARTTTGYVNPNWHADWLLWERSWKEALAAAGVAIPDGAQR